MVNLNEPVVLRCTDNQLVTTCQGVIWQVTSYRKIYRRQGYGREIAASVSSDVASEMCRLLTPYKGSTYWPRNPAQLRAVSKPVQEPLTLELKKLSNEMFEKVYKAAYCLGCFRLRDACTLRVSDACHGQSIDTVKVILQLESYFTNRRDDTPNGPSTSS